MRPGLTTIVTLLASVLVACGSGDSSRSAGAAGKAPPNRPYDGNPNPATATTTSTDTSTTTDTTSDTGTGTGTATAVDPDCEEKGNFDVENQVSFDPDCKSLRMLGEGKFYIFYKDSKDGRVLLFYWGAKGGNAPDTDKTYALADITSTTEPEFSGGFYKQKPIAVQLPPYPAPTSFSIRFTKVPKDEQSRYEATFEFIQPDADSPEALRKYKGSIKGNN